MVTFPIEATRLHGQLLIIHGGIDDNVHLQNAFALADALQREDKAFQIMVYPQSRHGIGGIHYDRLVVNFIRTVLQLPEPAVGAEGDRQESERMTPD